MTDRFVPFNVRRLRIARSWSQVRLGQSAGLTQDAVSSIERGLWVSDDRLGAIAQALGVPVADLKQPLPDSEIVTVCLGRAPRRTAKAG